MEKINDVLSGTKSSRETKKKYATVKQLLENSNTIDEVREILEQNKVAFDSNKITSGGTRKRRLKKTLRKRSKKTKKAGKRK